ncbi:hypothetical protein [Chondrinema litorale]|uniref:hypothetical protein n=1 Tax=Chondrinema litorale TaxID=2994555 RepID=UPI002543B734|nr:hypothetical protein [Chondrinema litorale]UZR93132.1 hypothetical protein OQ292_14830 [Chondrinema litorale]
MKKLIINLAFAIITELFKEEVSDEYLSDRLVELTGHLEKVPKALTDKDKNDKEQLVAIWQEARPDLVNWGLKEALEEVDARVKDAQKRTMFKNWLTEIADHLAGTTESETPLIENSIDGESKA